MSLLAQGSVLPALYDVTGVAENDVLNVREAPDASARIVSELAPGRTGIEVVAFNDDRSWGKVNVSESSGWVSMAFMTQQPGQIPGDKLPTPMWCYGTEPFWSLEIRADKAIFTDESTGADPMTSLRASVEDLPWSPRGNFVAGDAIGFVSREACSDGMSDRDYGWRVDFIRTANGTPKPFSGCCSLQK